MPSDTKSFVNLLQQSWHPRGVHYNAGREKKRDKKVDIERIYVRQNGGVVICNDAGLNEKILG